MPGTLHHGTTRYPFAPQKQRDPHELFIADHSKFGRSAVFHYVKQRDNRAAQPEIDSTALSRVTRQFVERLTDDQRHELIAVAAYHLAEGRDFEPGHETEDWLAAESQVESLGALIS